MCGRGIPFDPTPQGVWQDLCCTLVMSLDATSDAGFPLTRVDKGGLYSLDPSTLLR
jgi:hypothetical protein